MPKKNKKELTTEDLSKVKVGQQFSSQKELFEFLGLEFSSGNARACSRRTVEQYMKLDIKKKNDVRVLEIYNHVMPRDDKRYDKEYELQTEIDNLLYGFLHECPRQIITKNQLAYQLKCFSLDMYECLSKDEIEAAEETGVPTHLFHLFKSELNELGRRWIIARLRKLAEKGRLTFYEVIVHNEEYYSECTDEYSLYLKKRGEALEMSGFDSLGQALCSYKNSKKFYSKFGELLKECNLEGAYLAFYIDGSSFKPTQTIEKISLAESKVNERFCYKLQGRVFNRIKATDDKFEKVFKEEIYDKCDEFMREMIDVNRKFGSVYPIKGKFSYPDSTKGKVNSLLNKALISDVKLFQGAAKEIEVFYQPEKEKIKEENANESM